MIFELIGQDQIAERFRRLIQNKRFGSAYLFAGSEGVGKTSMALNIAAMLFCQDPQDGNACGECPACTKMRHMNHPNFHFIHAMPRGKSPSDNDPYHGLSETDFTMIREERVKLTRDPYAGLFIPGANQILISSIRHIKKELSMKPAESGHQIVFVHQAELTGIESFNALLKILEEPPRKTSFILTTNALELIPPTIRSRCQIVKFNPVPDIQIVDYLIGLGQDESNAHRIAGLCGGNINQARLLLDADFSAVDTTILDFWRIMMGAQINKRWVTMEDMSQLIEAFAGMAKTDPNAFRNELRFMIFWLRDAQLLEASPEASEHLINSHLLSELERFVEFYPAFPYFEMIQLIEETVRDVGRNMYVPALLGNLFMELRTRLLLTRKK